jgi:prepilin-type processing-associated H-X9-DG protein
VVNNYGVDETIAEIQSKRFQNWVNNVMTWGAEEYNTNILYIKNGILSTYTAGAVGIYKCPADHYLSAIQRARRWTERTRSMAMNAYVGPYDNDRSANWASGKNEFEPTYRQFLKLGDILNPAMIFVTLDEHPNSINDGYYLNMLVNKSGWGDAPATYHNGACGFSFADGHSEIHKWNGAWLNAPAIKTIPTTFSSPNFDAIGRQDFQWVWDRTSITVR